MSTSAPVLLPSCPGPVLAPLTVDGLGMPAADSDAYQPLSAAGQESLKASIQSALAGDADDAVNQAALADYVVCSDGDRVRWQPAGFEGRATAILDVDGAAIQLQTPHPVYDTDTLTEGVAMFAHLGARVLLTAGTHRCASNTASSCDGNSSVCTGTSEAYRDSDQAHREDTSFMAMHLAFSDAFPGDLVVSVHGMGDDGASVSNGTTDAVAADSPVGRVAAALQDTFAGEPITVCNDHPGAVVDARLCGTTNVQGRHLNGAADACDDAASSASGRFLHLEQSRALRDRPQEVADALSSAL